MRALDIPPHSRRLSRLAVAGLALVATAALAEGFLRQHAALAPEPISPAAGLTISTIPEATPAPALQVAQASAPRRARPADDAPEDAGEAGSDAVAATDATAPTLPADAAAAPAADAAPAPEPPAQPAAPAPDEPPT